MIAGADGCRAGWVVATRDGALVTAELDLPRWHALGIDIPIGLPFHRARECDREARRLLGRRGVCVFPTPARRCLGAPTFADAVAANRTALGVGISQQAFRLLPKIAQVDALVSPRDEPRIAEVHPECSFALLAGRPLPPKRTAEGAAVRRTLLIHEFGSLPPVPAGAKEDDLLDAYAVLWSAERFHRGTHETLGDGERDERGLVMRMVI